MKVLAHKMIVFDQKTFSHTKIHVHTLYGMHDTCITDNGLAFFS